MVEILNASVYGVSVRIRLQKKFILLYSCYQQQHIVSKLDSLPHSVTHHEGRLKRAEVTVVGTR